MATSPCLMMSDGSFNPRHVHESQRIGWREKSHRKPQWWNLHGKSNGKCGVFSGQIVPTNQSNDIFPICSGFYQHFPMFSEGGPRIFPCFPTFSECFLRFPRVFPCFPSGFLGFSEGFPLGIPSGYGVELAGAVRQGFGIGAHDLPSCDGEILGHRTWWERANHGMIVNDDSLWIHPSTFPMEVFGAPC